MRVVVEMTFDVLYSNQTQLTLPLSDAEPCLFLDSLERWGLRIKTR